MITSFRATSTKLSARRDMRLEENRELYGGGDGKMVLEDRTFFLVIQYQVLAFLTVRVVV